jgi:hypothetical protein
MLFGKLEEKNYEIAIFFYGSYFEAENIQLSKFFQGFS